MPSQLAGGIPPKEVDRTSCEPKEKESKYLLCKPTLMALRMNYYAHIKRTSAMSSFREIHLPTPIFVQAIGFTGFRLYLTIFRRMPWRSQSTTLSPQTPLALRNHNTTFILSAACTTLGLAYLRTSYVPISENQMLHASVPVRLFISVLFLGRLLVTGRDGFSQKGY